MSTLRARLAVRKGAEFLDEKCDYSDWRKRIDLEELDLSNVNDCVLGQVFKRDYYEALLALDISEPDATQLGFESGRDYTARELTSAWVEYLKPKEEQLSFVMGADGLWRHKETPTSMVKIVGGLVEVGGKEYWPVVSGYMHNKEFSASGDPYLMQNTNLYNAYQPWEPKPEFPAGSFLTDKKTQKEIFFVAPTCVYRMHINANGQMVRATGSDAIDFYADKYGPLTPVRKADGDPVAFEIAE